MKKYIMHGHNRFWAILSVLFIFLGVLSFGVHSYSYAAKGELMTLSDMKAKKDDILTVTQGMAEIVDVGGEVSDVMVADPSIVDVMALQANRLYVVGMAIGTTNIMAVDEGGNVVKRFSVQVKFDDQAVQDIVDELFPNEDVTIKALTSQVIVTGHVSSPAVADRVIQLVGHVVEEMQDMEDPIDSAIVNMLSVGGEQQVMLKVKIVEASRSVLKELGLETDGSGVASSVGDLAQAAVASGSGLTTDPLGVGTLLYEGTTSSIQLTVRALEQNGLVNTLAEPNLTAISGETAGFLAGGDFPVPTSRDQDGNVIVTYRPFGVSLNFVPTVMDRDLISLQLGTEVSSISSQNSLVTNNLSIPGFNVRRAETTVELASGGSIVIAGLLQSEVTKNLSELPGIKDVPIIGKLISSDSFQRNETELLVIVTAYLVKPYADKSAAKEVPGKEPAEKQNYALSTVLADNLRRTYGTLNLPEDLFDGNDGDYGYLIE